MQSFRNRSVALVVVYLFFLATLGFAEVRKVTQEDIEWGDPSTTVTSAGGHVGHRIDNTFSLSAPWVDVRAYGTIVLGAGASSAEKTTNAAAIVAAIAAAPSTGATVLLPHGVIYIDGDTVNINKHGVRLAGMGGYATQLYWDSGVAITVSMDNSATAIVLPEVRDLRLVGNGSANKVGIRMVNTSQATVENVNMYGVLGNTSIGLQVRGKDLGKIRNVSISADRPISIEDNPNSTIDIDHFDFNNVYLIANDNTQACVNVASGVNLTHTGFDGHQAWAGGKHGFYWNDTTSTSASIGLRLHNIRYEQNADDTGWGIWIVANSNLYLLDINEFYSSSYNSGIYLRNARRNVSLKNSLILSDNTHVYLNADSTVYPITIENLYYDTTSTLTLSSPIVTWLDRSWLTYTPTITGYDNMTLTSQTISLARYRQTGKTVDIQLVFTGTVGGTPSSTFLITFPASMTPATPSASVKYASISTDNGALVQAYVSYDSNYLYLDKVDASNWTAGAMQGNITMTYELQ